MNTKITYDVARHVNAVSRHGLFTSVEAESLYRPVTRLGTQQALSLSLRIRNEVTKPSFILHSPAPRALILAATVASACGVALLEMSELFTPSGTDGTMLNSAFARYKYDINSYLADVEILSVLNRWAKRTTGMIQNLAVSGVVKGRDHHHILIVTHAVLGNFLAVYLAGTTSTGEVAMNTVPLGEADRLRVAGSQITHLPLD